ncbi:MAG TPA: hypothetical protein VGL81_29515 [Polyangiaceae bacterium]|jgi:hypothetical protein
MATNSRTNKQGKDQQVIQGVQKDLETMSSLPLGGETFTPASLVTLVQSRIDAGNQVVTAKANWQNAAKTYTAIDTKCTVVVHDLKQLVIGAFGATSSKLADFGFTARKVTVLTPDQKVAAAAKRKATRAARNTMGPKKKLTVTGVTAAAAAAASAAPVAPATPAAPAAPPAGQNSAAPAAATNGAPIAAPAVAPATAPTVTVNVTTTPAAASPGTTAATTTAVTPAPVQAPEPVAPAATAATGGGQAPAKS